MTIFGESAGGGSVSLLPLIDQADGLFHRMIIESGSVALTFSREECQKQTQLLLEESGCSNMEELMALDEDALMAMINKIADYNDFYGKRRCDPAEGSVWRIRIRVASDIDMLIGTNADECRCWINEMGYTTDLISGKLFYTAGMPVMFDNNLLPMTEEDQTTAENFVKNLKDKTVWNLTEFYNEMLFRLPAIEQADLHADHGGNTYVYYWAYPGAFSDIGTCHAVELAYVFGNLDNTIYTGDHIDPALSETVQTMWVNFARSLDPGTDDIENDIKGNQRQELHALLKYNLNGCYAQLSYQVPAGYKLIAIAAGAAAVVITVLIVLIKKIIKKHR